MLDAPGAHAIQPLARLEGVAPEDLRLMAEIGFLGAAMGRAAAMRPIFEMIDAARPDSAAGAVGLALADAAAGREREALARLRRAILTRKRSINEAKAAFCALAAAFGRESEAAPWRRDLLRGPESAARRLAAAPAPRAKESETIVERERGRVT